MWSQDYCTVCDKQCALGSMYCSDQCRILDSKGSDTSSVEYHYNLKSIEENHIHNNNSKKDSEYQTKRQSQFMYVSPILAPQPDSDDHYKHTNNDNNTNNNNNAYIPSPPPSPLLMPAHAYFNNHTSISASSNGTNDNTANVASSSYRQWVRVSSA